MPRIFVMLGNGEARLVSADDPELVCTTDPEVEELDPGVDDFEARGALADSEGRAMGADLAEQSARWY